MTTTPNLPAVQDDTEISVGDLISEGMTGARLDWFDQRLIPADWAADEFNARGIDKPQDYPDGLEHFFVHGGGFRLDYASITGGPGWSQIRLDAPPVDEASGRPRKYIGNSGDTTGERLILSKSMRKRFEGGTYTRVIITEGTGQTLLASYLYRDQDDVLVVGVPGCWGWSSAGVAAAELHRVCSRAEHAVIAFDADVLSNPHVFDAGTVLSGVVEGATGTRPGFLRLPVSGTNGFDDYIAATFRTTDADGTVVLDEVEARRTLGNLMKSKQSCKALTTQRPRGKAVATTRASKAYVSREDLAVYAPPRQGEIGPQPIAGFAPYIERSYKSTSRLDPEGGVQILHDLAAETPIGTLRVEGWPNKKMKEIEGWLEAMGYAHGVWTNADGFAALIVAAMKQDAADRGVDVMPLYTETGWGTTSEGDAIWFEPHGGITAKGFERNQGRANLSDPNGRRIDLTCLENSTHQERVAAMREYVFARHLFADQSWYILTFGSQAWSLGGHLPEGMTYMLGEANIGKTQRQGPLARTLGPGYRMETLVGKNVKVGSDIAQGLHHCLSVPDDLAGEDGDRGGRQQMIDILDMLARRAGGSDGEVNGRAVKKDVNGKWEQGEPDPSHVSFAASGEEMPAELMHSSKQRILSIPIKAQGWTVPDENGQMVDRFDDWLALDKAGTLRLATGALLMHYAGKIDKAGSMEAWLEAMRAARTQVARKIWSVVEDEGNSYEMPRKYNRLVTVAAGRLAGWRLAVEAAVEMGAITKDEGREAIAKGVDVAVETMMNHYRNYIQGDTGQMTGDRLLDLLREATASGQWVVGSAFGTSPSQGQRLLGAVNEVGGEKYLALVGRTVAEVAGVPRGKVNAALRDVAVPNSKGGYTHDVRFLGETGSTSAYRIPWSVWEKPSA